MKKYLVSVGIATRNRGFYMLKVFDQLYKLGKDVQIVISDNSDNNELEHQLKEYIDNDRVKYIYTKDKLSVVNNYNITATHATGEYYICIGDDDIVLSNVLDLAKWMRKCNIDAVKTSREITYIWPGASSKFGRISFTSISKKSYSFDCEQGVIEALQDGCQNYLITNMVGSYHGLVRMSRMNEVFDKTGVYFGGFSPDIYSATCLSLLPNMKCVYLDFPISVPGSCAKSATNRSSKRTAISTVEEAIKTYSNIGYKWSEEIPYFYTPETTWAETMTKAIKAMGREDLFEYFNKKTLVNSIYTRWTDYAHDLYSVFTEEERNLISDDYTQKANTNYSKLRKLLRRFHGEVKDIFFVSDNFKAKKKIDSYMKKKVNFDNYWESLKQDFE
ncbi:MAG: glycosyltransferase [Erysipelotrichaceae bacterium]|nr:glycosyltransferase [Erysipelotrichaceae bacterium]